MTHNLINIKDHPHDFKDSRLSYSVSSRDIRPDIDIIDYLKILYMYCDLKQIDSVFGHTTSFSKLYGGRVFKLAYALTRDHLDRMADNGIGLALTLTNHFFDEDAYKESLNLLKTHHKKGNAIICTNDQLAVRLKNDFPDYEIKASIIKNINTLDKVKKALAIYDSLTLPMDKNDDDQFLADIVQKHRIILFGNAGCAYTCPARTCYLECSQQMTGRAITASCSKATIPRAEKEQVYFNVKKLADMGYGRFKLIPIPRHGFEQTARHYSTQKKYFIRTMKQRKGLYYLCSYPKCGRTWVRFMLANYINLFFDLKRDIDLHSMFYFFPNDKAGGRKGPETYGACDDHRFPLLLSSHEPYTPDMFENENIVFLLRSIPDVVVSDYFQMSRFLGRFKGSLKDYVRDEKGGLERYCRYLNTWIPRLAKDCAVILTYEKLHQDSMQALSDILNFMAIPCDQQIARQAIKLSSFHQMQKKEQEKGIPDSENNFNDPEARRMRKGLPGGFADYLDRETLEYMNRRCSKILKKETQQFLSTWGIAPDVVTQKIGT